MDALIRLAHLTEEDVLNFSEKVAENLAIAFDSLSQQVSELKSHLSSKESANDEALKLLRDECDQYLKERNLANEALENLRSSFDSLENKCLHTNIARDELATKLNHSQSLINELETAIKNLENDKEGLSDQLTQRSRLIDEYVQKMKLYEEEKEHTKQQRLDALAQLEDAKSLKSSVQSREQRLLSNIDSLQKHNTWLEEQLHDANDKLLSIRRDHTEKYLALESDLSMRKSELLNAQTTVAKLEGLVKKLTESNEDHILKLKLRSDELVNVEHLHANEISAQKRLNGLLKEQASDAEKKVEEMQEAMKSMQDMLQTGHEHILQLQEEKTALLDSLIQEKDILLGQIQGLTLELDSAREIVDKFRIQGLSEDELRKLNPAVATTIASLKRGRSLTEIYSDYVQIVEERDMLKLDKQRLTEHVREMVTQLEEKGPILRSQQEAFFKSKSRAEELEQELSNLQSKINEAQESNEDLTRRAGYFQRQNLRLKQSCKDMSNQVKTLLRELELARGTVLRSDAEEVNDVVDSSGLPDETLDSHRLLDSCIAANKVIDENLVTYTGITELQAQNQRLLLVARDLATQLERSESLDEELSARVTHLSAKVDALSGDLEVARIASREARSELDLAQRQREALRRLLERHSIPVTSADQPPDYMSIAEQSAGSSCADNLSMVVHADSSVHASVFETTLDRAAVPASPMTSKLEESLRSLHSEFKQYREEKTKTDELYTVTIENLRKEASEARILNQKLASQLDFTHEKFRTLEVNVSNYKSEIAILREMNARYTTSAAASDEAVMHLREEVARTADRLTAAEVDCRQLTRQLEHARANETRLTHELETVRKQNVVHDQLMHQLQSIQSNLSHRDEMEERQSNRRIVALETELVDVKRRAEERIDTAMSQNTTLQSELLFAKEALKTAEKEMADLRISLAALDKAKSQLSTSPKVSTPPDQLQTSCSTGDLDMLGKTASATKLREVERECESLRVCLESSKKQFADLQKLAGEMEEHITSLTNEREELNRVHAADSEERSQRCEFLELQLNLEKMERLDLVSENSRLTENLNKTRSELQADLTFLRAELVAANHRKEEAIEYESRARGEVEAHQKTAQEAREKYEMELQLHAQDVQLLTEARKAADDAKSVTIDLKCEIERTQTKLREVETNMSVQSDLWEDERNKLSTRAEDANAEVDRLHQQILKLTEQIVGLRKLMEHSSADVSASDYLVTQNQASEDFVQILDYLRRQKAIAETAEESANAECARLNLRAQSLEHQISDLQQKLADERRRSEIKAETSLQHAQLMSQLEQLNVVHESNRLLRQERETVREAAAHSEAQLAALRADIEPLRLQNKDLEDAREVLISEKRSLEEERDRWKERCSRLVETTKRMDPEEYKKACDERDHLQQQLRLLEDAKSARDREVDSQIAISNMRVEELTANLSAVESQLLAKESQLALVEEKLVAQKEELGKKQTNIAKLREIGRKYRQETDELRRQLSSTHAKEATMKTAEEAKVAAQADLMNARSNLEQEHERCSRLSAALDRLKSLLDLAETLPAFANILPCEPGHLIDGSLVDVASSSHSVEVEQHPECCIRLNYLLSNVADELTRLRAQAESQRERLLRAQLIESQLTKAKREAADLKARLAVHSDYGSALASSTVLLPDAVMPSTTATITSLLPTATQSLDPAQQEVVTSEITTVASFVASSTPVSTGSTSPSQPSHSWILRAAATVQPVQTPPPQSPAAVSLPPANSPSPMTTAGLTSNRQTAEIRPITNNVATVLPTPTTVLEQGSHLHPIPEASFSQTGSFISASPLCSSASTSLLFMSQSYPATVPNPLTMSSVITSAGTSSTAPGHDTTAGTSCPFSNRFPAQQQPAGCTLFPSRSPITSAWKRSYAELVTTSEALTESVTETPVVHPSTSVVHESSTCVESQHQLPADSSEAKRPRASAVNFSSGAPETRIFISPMVTGDSVAQSVSIEDKIGVEAAPVSSIAGVSQPEQLSSFPSPVEVIEDEVDEDVNNAVLHEDEFRQFTPPESADFDFFAEADCPSVSASMETTDIECNQIQSTTPVEAYVTSVSVPSLQAPENESADGNYDERQNEDVSTTAAMPETDMGELEVGVKEQEEEMDGDKYEEENDGSSEGDIIILSSDSSDDEQEDYEDLDEADNVDEDEEADDGDDDNNREGGDDIEGGEFVSEGRDEDDSDDEEEQSEYDEAEESRDPFDNNDHETVGDALEDSEQSQPTPVTSMQTSLAASTDTVSSSSAGSSFLFGNKSMTPAATVASPFGGASAPRPFGLFSEAINASAMTRTTGGLFSNLRPSALSAVTPPTPVATTSASLFSSLGSNPTPGLFNFISGSRVVSSTSSTQGGLDQVPSTSMHFGLSKQKIQPIVWNEPQSQRGSIGGATDESDPLAHALRVFAGSRRKNWGGLRGASTHPRGSSRGGPSTLR